MPELLVSDIMTKEVKTVGRNDSVATADQLMQLGRIRHLVVLDEDGSLVGVLSQRDLFLGGLLKALGYGTHAKTRALEMLVVKEAMVSDVVTTTPHTPLSRAADTMLSRKIGCLPVVDADGKLVGIVTESDFVAQFAGRG
jgi:CBS domain-containing membrane protein